MNFYLMIISKRLRNRKFLIIIIDINMNIYSINKILIDESKISLVPSKENLKI